MLYPTHCEVRFLIHPENETQSLVHNFMAMLEQFISGADPLSESAKMSMSHVQAPNFASMSGQSMAGRESIELPKASKEF